MRKKKTLCVFFRSCPRGQKEPDGVLMTARAEEGLKSDHLEKTSIHQYKETLELRSLLMGWGRSLKKPLKYIM